MLQAVNHGIGVFVCWITGRHREPHITLGNHIWKVEFCNRCGHIFKKEKIGATFKEILNDAYENSGNQIW